MVNRSEAVQADFDKVTALMKAEGINASEACRRVGRKPNWYHSVKYQEKLKAEKAGGKKAAKAAVKTQVKMPLKPAKRKYTARAATQPEVINLEVIAKQTPPKTLAGFFMVAFGDEKQVLEFAKGLRQ